MWVKSDVDFNEPIGTLTIAMRRSPAVLVALAENQDNPVALEKYLLELVKHHRPDLAGGSVYGMRLDMYNQEWEIMYAHPGMPRRKPGETMERIPLIQAAEQFDPLT